MDQTQAFASRPLASLGGDSHRLRPPFRLWQNDRVAAVNHVERFRALMNFEPVDRLPMVEWAGWWDLTVDRWHEEGLPAELTEAAAIRDYLGLDCYLQRWVGAATPSVPSPASHGAGVITDARSYDEMRQHLYPDPAVDPATLARVMELHQRGEAVFWITLDGFFWFARTLLGIERHLFAFYDMPELMHRMNADLTAFNIRVLQELDALCVPEFMTFAEDMSYNHGPMLSKESFDEFLAPYYRQVVPELKARGIVPMVDSDGDVHKLVPWLREVQVEGILPLERMAGVDVVRLRREHPRWRMVGGFDKTVMKHGEAAMRREFERLMPCMQQGGYVPAVDHQTPPDVSLEMYRVYVKLLREYCERAARQ